MLPLPRIIDTTLGKFLVWEHEYIAKKLAEHGTWEPFNIELAKRLLVMNENDDVLDVGANFGAFAVPVAKLDCGLVHAIEPQRIIFQQLCANAFLNGLDNLHAHHLAVGDPHVATEYIDFPDPDYALEINPGGLSMLTFAEYDLSHVLSHHLGAAAKRTQKVRYVSVDSLNLENIGLVKIDVEGAEELVIRGAHATLARNMYPPILFEAWVAEWYRERRDSLVRCLEALGYEVTLIGEYGVAQHRTQPRRCNIEHDLATGNAYIS